MDQPLRESQNTVRLPIYSTPQRRAGVGNSRPQTFGQRYINCYPESYRGTMVQETEYATVKRPGILNGPALTNTIASYGTGTTMSIRANICITALDDVYVSAWYDSTASKIYIIQYRPLAGTTTKIGELTSVASTDYVFLTEFTQDVGGTYPAGTLTPAVALTYMNAARTLGAGYYATSSGGVFTASSLNSIASASFPSNLGTPKVITGPIVQLDGTLYVMTTEGTIYGSGGTGGTLYDITSWNTNTIVAASMYPDKGVAVWRFKNALLAFGQDSVEFFVDAQIPPPSSPLERTDQASFRFGCLSPKLICTVDDAVYWVAKSSSGTMGVWGLENGYTPVKISDVVIDTAMDIAWTSGPNCTHTMEVANMNYTKHLIINGPLYYTIGSYDTGGVYFDTNDDVPITPGVELLASTVCYSLKDQVWWGFTGGFLASGFSTFIYPVSNASSSTTPYRQFLFYTRSGTPNTGLYEFNNNAAAPNYRDDSLGSSASSSSAVTAAIQFNTYWFGTEKRKFINKVKAVMDRILREDGTDTTNIYQFYIAYIKDNKDATSGPQFARQVHLSTTTESIARYYTSNLGAARAWTFIVACKHPGDFRCQGLEVDVEQGTA